MTDEQRAIAEFKQPTQLAGIRLAGRDDLQVDVSVESGAVVIDGQALEWLRAEVDRKATLRRRLNGNTDADADCLLSWRGFPDEEPDPYRVGMVT